MNALDAALTEFDAEHVGLSKGALSLVLILTRSAKARSFPLDAKDFETASGGQVAGLGGGILARILRDHAIERVLSSEGGRTSRGNMERMRSYIDLLNAQHRNGTLDLEAAEAWWVERIKHYFDSQPFTLKLDPARSLRSCVGDLLSQAVERQRQARGTMYAGAVMQHLVGAKLDIVSAQSVTHHGFAVADSSSNRGGDFAIADVVVHVTTAPAEALIKKCQNNLSAGLRPVIVTTEDGVGGFRALAKNAGVEDRIDIIEIEQFIAANIYEAGFKRDSRPVAVRQLIEKYNEIVSKNETDLSLRIEFDG